MANVPSRVVELVETFDRNIETYKKQPYNEAQVRREFIDPFFEELGWDVTNKNLWAPAYREVIHEDAIKIGGYTEAPDYCFRIGGVRKFFVEAKKPSIDIKGDPHPAYKLRRYAWSANLPLSILTDFEEFAAYDCLAKPKDTDKASAARVMYFNYKDYTKKWDEIAKVFSKEAILKGSFDKFAGSTKAKRGTTAVDKEFLGELEKWRRELARIIALRNTTLSAHQINFAVQRTIDRIIFLRMCEDRGIERYGQLQGISSGSRTYPRLCELFEKADHKYNSGLFYFQKEPGRPEGPDELTLNLVVDDNPLKYILHSLYYPQCPYEFSVLPAEILGSVYEQFLGSVIRVSSGRRTKVEPKPEVKKAGGIYYTPNYIVDYIVKNTVGKLLGDLPACHSRESGNPPCHCEATEGGRGNLKSNNHKSKIVNRKSLTPKQVANLRILDPACGSGSFLLSAYTYLLNYHRDWYVDNNPNKHTKQIYQGRGGQWFLTIAEKKRILLNNIFGVDIDSQAVEVTKLSLLLKVLEGESQETLRLFPERALPDLGNNIKCGNSLIGPDFFDDLDPKQRTTNNEQRTIPKDLYQKINAFDWKAEFPHIFKTKNPGFNAVIGNPPYGATFTTNEALYFQNKYSVFKTVKDVYTLFVERSLNNLCMNGKLSFIVPSAWLGGPDYLHFRSLFLKYQIKKLILLPFDVFADAYIDTAVFVLSKNRKVSGNKVQTYVYGKKEKISNIDLVNEDYDLVYQDQWAKLENKKFVLSSATIRLVEQIRSNTSLTFGDVIQVKRGVLFDKQLLTNSRSSPSSYRYFEGDVYRYRLNLVADRWVEFDDKIRERPKEFIWFKGERLLLRRLVNRRQRLMACFAHDTFITNKNLYSLLTVPKGISILAVLGILNSRLISYLYINQVTQATKDDFPQVTIKDLKFLPFPKMRKGETRHNKLVKLVQRMLDLHNRLAKAKVPAEKTRIQRQITTTDKQIDNLTYDLYGLTNEEIKIVEQNI